MFLDHWGSVLTQNGSDSPYSQWSIFVPLAIVIIMESYFPSPFPDESLYSLVTRYRSALPHSNRQIEENLFGYKGQFSLKSFLGQNANIFFQRDLGVWGSKRAFIRTMTGYNLLSPFLTNSPQVILYKSIQGYAGCLKTMLRPHLYFPNQNFVSLKFCPECVGHDVREYGVAYWHRSHCVWFTNLCWNHQCQLVKVEKSKGRFHLPPQIDKNHQGRNKYSGRARVLSAEPLVQELMAGKLPFGVNLNQLCKAYSEAVSDDNSLSKEADILQEKVTDCYDAEMLRVMRIRTSFNGQPRRRWVAGVLKGSTPVHIPEHLLVIKELFGSISALTQSLGTLPPSKGEEC